MDQSTQRNLLYAGAAIILGYAAYQVYVTSTASSTSSSSPVASSSQSTGDAAPKKSAYTPRGNPMSWSEDDMKKFLNSRNLGVGLEHASRHELQAMVESKLHEPTSTGFDDPEEWSSEEMKDYLKKNGMAPGHHPSRMELLAMVESQMHAPK
ncbi:hypothetical protein LTR53_006146 [Teratosphaeriaceae sp. CCFEE 6253]|nr:hypothetical protein LTR53_006146 [Teratosphaeriaceae sp. CCFEE 6253]